MKVLVLLLAFLQAQGQQPAQKPTDSDTLPYENLQLGLKFSYPKTWEVTTNKKSESRIIIPIENTSDRAVVEVFPVSFRSETNVWQLSEATINKSMKREVERQWEEQILGVPLLLTRVNYNDNGNPKTSETGLIYSLGFSKMEYRITSSPDEFDKADFAWRQVLQSLRTWDGSLPQAEDPNVKIERKDAPNTPGGKDEGVAHPTVPHDVRPNKATKFINAPVGASADFSGRKVNLHFPAAWKADSNKDGTFILHNPALSGPVAVTLYAVSGSDPAGTALLKLSGADLNDYSAVSDRNEQLALPNKAGASVAWISRSGKGVKGDLFTVEGTCEGGDFYAVFNFRSTDAAKWKLDWQVLQGLFDQVSIESGT